MRFFLTAFVLMFVLSPVVHSQGRVDNSSSTTDSFWNELEGAANTAKNTLGQVENIVSEGSSIVSRVKGISNKVTSTINTISSIFGDDDPTRYKVNKTGFTGDAGVMVVKDFDSLFNEVSQTDGVTPKGGFILPEAEKFNQIGENTSLRDYILRVVNFFLTFLGLIAVTMLVYAGFLYVSSAGDDSNMDKAKKIIIYAIVGILVILGSFAIINTVLQNAGQGTGDRGETTNVATRETKSVTDEITGSSISVDPIGSSLTNLIVVSGEGVKDLGSMAVATPAAAQNGLTFSLATQGLGVLDFGDGVQLAIDSSTDPEATATYSFGEEKTYTVRLIVDTVNGRLTDSKQLVVGGNQARINASNLLPRVDQAIVLDAGQSTISSGSAKKYSWTCASVNQNAGCFADVTGKEASVSFNAPGAYQVALELETTLGQTALAEKTITVVGSDPTASFSYELGDAAQPLAVSFDASGSQNRLGNEDGLRYFWSFNGELKEVSTAQTIHVFTTGGNKLVELIVVDGNSRSPSISQTISLTRTLPVDFEVQ